MPDNSYSLSDGQIWQRQPGETAKAFAAFALYRDTPPKDRGIAKCFLNSVGGPEGLKASGRSAGNLRQWEYWSSRWHWVDRVRAYDDEQERIALDERVEAIKAMQKRHVQIAMGLQQKAVQRLHALQPDELGVDDLLRFLNSAIKIERQALGEAGDIHEVSWRAAAKRSGIDPDEFFTSVVDEAARKLAGVADDDDAEGNG